VDATTPGRGFRFERRRGCGAERGRRRGHRRSASSWSWHQLQRRGKAQGPCEVVHGHGECELKHEQPRIPVRCLDEVTAGAR
jgi:hypothetical protein